MRSSGRDGRRRLLRSGESRTAGAVLQSGGSPDPKVRNYLQLSEALITGLVGSLGAESGKMILRDVGVRTGESVASGLLMKGNFVKDPSSFADLYVKGLMQEMGTNPRLLRIGPNSVEFEQSACPFAELADKFPALVCDVLDEAVHEGIDRRSGLKTTRLACLGHGEPACRFKTVWPTAHRSSGKARGA